MGHSAMLEEHSDLTAEHTAMYDNLTAEHTESCNALRL